MDDEYFKLAKRKGSVGTNSAQPDGTIAGGGQQGPAMGPMNQTGGGAKDQSVGRAGSGFVNLSQMLDLNGQSGRKNANQMARDTAGAANGEQAMLGGMMGQFNKQATAGQNDAAGMIKYDESGNPVAATGTGGDLDKDQQAIDSIEDEKKKLAEGYKGPGSLSEMQGYNPLAKALLGTGETAGNLAKGGQGYAAEIAKATGLSPTQSAAGAFYGGVNNQALKQTGSDYKDLGNQLDAANQESAQTAELARQRMSGDSQALSGYEKQMSDYWTNQQKSAAAGPKSFQDLTANDTTHTMDAGTSGRRNTTENGSKIASNFIGAAAGMGTIGQGGDAWDVGKDLMSSIGITDGTQQSQTWNDFLASLPEGMRNYVNGMIKGGNPGVEYYGDKIAPKNSADDWNWFASLFDAYLNQPGGSSVKGGGKSNTSQSSDSKGTKHEN